MRISEFKYEIKGNVKSVAFWFLILKNVKLAERLEPAWRFSLRLNFLRRET